MTLSPTALEAAAKALYRELENRPLYAQTQMNGVIANECATAAITAYLAQAEKEGWVMVPARTVTDAKRYHWLRDGNSYAPEEQDVRGGDELDALCDEYIAAAQNGGE